MKVAITNATDWPFVRRGAERFCNELARDLTARGHDVTIIAAKPGRGEESHDRGYRVLHFRRLWHPWFQRVGVLEFHTFFFTALYALLRRRYDVVLCCTFMDALAARVARRFRGAPYVFLVNGIPPKQRYYRTLTLRGALIRRAVAGADEVITLSRYMQDYFRDRFARPGVVVPIPVDTDRFHPRFGRKTDPPVILCAAALDDARKGGRLLMEAFDRVRQSGQPAVLWLCGVSSDEIRLRLLENVSPQWQRDVAFLNPQGEVDLPRLYAEAAITVLPSVWEAFGMVILESLASGTPVVGTRDGAIPELLGDGSIGCLFDPGEIVDAEATNVAGLTDALIAGLQLSRDPGTAERCRRHAESFGWSRLGATYESILRRVVEGTDKGLGVDGGPR